MNIGEALTRKLGPLPTWGWGVALGGGVLVWQFIRGGGPTSGQKAAAETPTFVNPDPGTLAHNTQGFLNDLTAWLQRQQDTLQDIAAKQQPPATTETPTGDGNSTAPPPTSTTPPPTTTTPPPTASAPLSTFTQLRRDAYNYAQAFYAAKLGPNPGSYSTFTSRLPSDATDPFKYWRQQSYIWAQEQFKAGKAPNPGSYTTYSTAYPDVQRGT